MEKKKNSSDRLQLDLQFAGSNPAPVAAQVATRSIVAEGSDPSAAHELPCVCSVCGTKYATAIALAIWCTPSKHALLENLKREIAKRYGGESLCVALDLTVEHWKAAHTMAELHLKRKYKGKRTHARQHSRRRNRDEEIRVATDGLVVELALQQKYYPSESWNAPAEQTTLADIGANHEVRSYNAMPCALISEWWQTIAGRTMNLGNKRDISFLRIRDFGHVEVYKTDAPERDVTFIVIEKPDRAWIVGTAAIKDCQKAEYWGKNFQYEMAGEEQSKCFWAPVSVLTPAMLCDWYKSRALP